MSTVSDVVKRVIVKYDADEKDLLDALDDLEAGNKAMAEQFGESAAAAHKAFDTIGLGTAKVSGLQKWRSEFQNVTGVIGQGISKIDEFGKALGPWNQTLELGGKALRFLGDGMEAYAKTSPRAKAEVEALTKEFTKMKDAAMAAVGEFTVAVAQSIDIAGNIEKLRYGLGAAGTAKLAFDKYFDEKAVAGRGVAFMFGGGLQKSFAETFRNDWYTGPTPDELLAKVGEKMKDYTAAAKKAAEEEKKLHEAQRKRHAELMQQMRSAWREAVERREVELEREAAEIRPEMSREQMNNQRGFYLDEQLSGGLPPAARELQRRERAKFLENTFGPIEEFNAYATAFGTLDTAVQSSMQAWISGSMTMGVAIKKGIGDALAGLASQLAVESLKHGAYAIGSLAFGDVRGAGQHGAAATAFGVGAAAAAAASKKLGASVAASQAAVSGTSGGSGGGRGGGGASAASAGGSTSVASSDQASVRPVIVYLGDHWDSDERRRRQRTEEAVDRALRERDG